MITESVQATSRSVLRPSALRRRHDRARTQPAVLNDVHAKLNATEVADVVAVRKVGDIFEALHRARRENRPLSVSGGRHSMGGQQFAVDAIHLDMRAFNRVVAFDDQAGTITVEAGIEWPKLLRDYHVLQHPMASPSWGIAQKQTGADRLSIGGAVAANIHGRCLSKQPFVQDIVSLTVIDAQGQLIQCSRRDNRELFRLVVGGYGLFGIVVWITIQLVPRQKVQRIVDMLSIDQLMPAFGARIQEGYLYGDFQFAIDPTSPGFLKRGVFSCYRPVEPDTPIPARQVRMSKDDWNELIHLAHVDKSGAFNRFRDFYQSSSGQLYWSDTHQLNIYLDDYHGTLDQRMCSRHKGTEIISELFVPRHKLVDFMNDVRQDFRNHDAGLIYGTIRLIEQDDVSFLNWARESYACVIFNLHTEHTSDGISKSRSRFCRLIDFAIKHHGSFFLTYHRFATANQILAAYPQFREFLLLKQHYDPRERIQSQWYRHYKRMFPC